MMKDVYYIYIVVLLGILFVAGCAKTISTDVNNDDRSAPATTDTSAVTRSFSASEINAGDALTVTLTKNVDSGVLLVEEHFPSGWSVVDAGGGSIVGNTIRWAELSGSKKGELTYVVRSESTKGDATWGGQYSLGGKPPVDIGGSNKVLVN